MYVGLVHVSENKLCQYYFICRFLRVIVVTMASVTLTNSNISTALSIIYNKCMLL